ncbi:MAG: hypothetical protein JW918_18070 [Anaerolineae bacterium]|nr:hypothetical protein [Anaerolineae bacterium]
MTDATSQIILAFRWYLATQAFGLAALPLCLKLFRHLPDRGYGVSKPMGLLLAGWAFWLLASLGWLRNTAGGVLVALGILAVAGTVLYLTKQPSTQLPWRAIVVAEAVFALAFAAWCIVRAHMPRIETAGGEKWMEIAFLRGILRSDAFPPHDPWLSGFAISYYYFGYVIMAMLTRLTDILPSMAFNLGIATLFALTCTGAFSLAYNLIAARKGAISEIVSAERERWSAVLGGLLGPLLVALVGNLEGLMEVLYARGIGSAAFWEWVDIRSLTRAPPAFADGSWIPTRFYWWWQASRVVRDYSPLGDHVEIIDEFPAFSFLLGDMHPHVLALPFVLLVISLALDLYLRVLAGESRDEGRSWKTWDSNLRSASSRLRLFFESLHTNQGEVKWAVLHSVLRSLYFGFRSLLSDWSFSGWELLVYAVCLGGLGFLNTWDFPIYLFLVTVAYAVAHLGSMREEGRLTFYALRSAVLFISLLLLGFFLYQPFWRSFQSQAGGVIPNLFGGTRLTQFLLMFGPLLFIACAFVIGRARRSGVRAGQVTKWTLGVSAGILVVLVLIAGLAALLIRTGWTVELQGAARYLDAWLRGEHLPDIGEVPGPWTLARQRVIVDPKLLGPAADTSDLGIIARAFLISPVWVILGLVAFLVTIVLVLRGEAGVKQPAAGIRDFVLLLFATGALLVLSVEFVYIKDHFGTRMNTVFKFYFQAWILWSIGGAYALATFIRRGGMGGKVVSAVAAILILAGLLYPLLAIPRRADEYGGPVTLDGADYLARQYPADYAAITWLNEHVKGAPVILETPGGSYGYEGRVSAHTGLPTVLGWAGHEHQWRGTYDEQARRKEDIETLYTSVDKEQVLTLLDKYDISYVYVGPLERDLYQIDGLAKFAGLMEVAYESGDVVIYKR